MALDGTVKYHNVYNNQEKQEEDFFKGFYCMRLKLQGTLGDYSISRWRNNNDLQDANGNMSSTIVRERK
jgi:hypothetical protein